MKKDEVTFICKDCYPGSIEYGMLFKRSSIKIDEPDFYSVVKIKDCFGIISGQGHKGDPIIWFKEKPLSKPLTSTDFKTTLANLGLFEVYRLIQQSIKLKQYDPEKDGFSFEIWLFKRCGKIIEAYEKRVLLYTDSGSSYYRTKDVIEAKILEVSPSEKWILVLFKNNGQRHWKAIETISVVEVLKELEPRPKDPKNNG